MMKFLPLTAVIIVSIGLGSAVALPIPHTAPPTPKFEAQEIDSIEIGYGLAIGDVNGDGLPDILLADKKQFVWYRNPDWERFVMIENLTRHDNVCIAARDIWGDGRVEVAVGAQWNPGNTSDTAASGSVHYLIRPDDPTQLWEPVKLPHEPTVHRMRWVRVGDRYRLVVLPLHGRGNVDGEGRGVRIIAYDMPEDPREEWTTTVIDDSMHMTHNFDVVPDDSREDVVFAGREGLLGFNTGTGEKDLFTPAGMERGAGEVRVGQLERQSDRYFAATIEPMHGDELVLYTLDGMNPERPWTRLVLDDTFKQGHAIACADLLGTGGDQIVAGWRNPNREGKVGLKLYVPLEKTGAHWKSYMIDDNGMACEDVRIADLDGDGKLDIVAAGRATKNLKIYWNKSGD